MRRRIAAALLVGWAALAPAWAEVAPALGDRDRAAIAEVIRSQIEAFRRDDGPTAFAHASPGIQGIFASPEEFLRMVREDYRPVYRPRRFEFLEVTTVHGRITQPVFLIGPDGAATIALYFMERDAADAWRVGGCVLVTPPAADA